MTMSNILDLVAYRKNLINQAKKTTNFVRDEILLRRLANGTNDVCFSGVYEADRLLAVEDLTICVFRLIQEERHQRGR
jgi:hypothetical protein